MVTLSAVTASNKRISSALPSNLVALFVGATSGIGEATLKKFAQYTVNPRVHLIGRSREAADRIVAECQVLNPRGQYVFRQTDVSLIRNVDKVCKDIKAEEECIHLLFMSCGVPNMDRAKTAENVHLLAAVNYYARIRFIQNLLPLVQRAPGFRRIVTVGGGSHEAELDTNDFPALKIPVEKFRGHLTSLVTLGLEGVAQAVPDVSFIHDYPGTVKTKLLDGFPEEVLKTFQYVPIEECGERHLFLATSAKFPPASGKDAGVSLEDGGEVAVGTSGVVGSGVYSVGVDCESASPAVLEILRGMRGRGLVQEVYRHTQEEFLRITTN
ncbi:NAD(P)-binding protein [Xylaria arbuscula]|nr:NAD(P)-binding protein [Xylaria arbuscula]